MKIAIVGHDVHMKEIHSYDTKFLYNKVGYNTGNLVYWYAVQKHLIGEKEYFGWNADTDYINSNFDAVVFPAANNLYPGGDMGILAKLFDAIKIPLIVTGLGAQADSVGDKIELTKGTLRFLDVIKEKCTQISVRGEYTAEILSNLGVHNVTVTGCPSNFINTQTVSKNFMQEKNNAFNKIAINMNINPKVEMELAKISEFLKENNSFSVITQDPLDLLQAVRDKVLDKNSYLFSFLDKIFGPEINLNELVLNNFDTFFNIECWIEHLRNFDLALGTRMHGNMLAFQSRIPTIFISHDSRVSEMVDVMKLPWISKEDLMQSISINDALKFVNFDSSNYNTQRALLTSRYCKIFEDSNLILSENLLNLKNKD